MPHTSLKFLFIHQNFPGQFLHLAPALAGLGHEVVALGVRPDARLTPGVRYVRYAAPAIETPSSVVLARDVETKVARGAACARAMEALKREGFSPDTIVAHPSWGEALFCKDVWPAARLIMFAEFFYSTESDYGFDPEFANDRLERRYALRLRNSIHLHALHAADAGYSPTRWQRQQLPPPYRDRFEVIFDGIDTDRVRPNPEVKLHLKRNRVTVGKGDEVVTFVCRNLEPYRGFHVFMRALPAILRQRPNARCLIVGEDGVSYGSKPAEGGTWRERMLREVGAQLPMDRVHFLGRLAYDDYLKVLQVSACHVYLTYPFVLSWSCLEAMSAGAVVVASRTPPVEEVIEDGVNGLLFDFFDLDGLTSRVVTVLERQQDHVQLAASARNTVVHRYDLKRRCLPRQVALVLGAPSNQPRGTPWTILVTPRTPSPPSS